MPKLDWVILCEFAFIDDSNRLGLLGEFTSIYFNEFPAIFPQMSVVTRWSGSGENHFYENITVVDEEQNFVYKGPKRFVKFNTSKATSIHKLSLLQFPEPRKYIVHVYKDNELCGSERFFARKAGPEKAQ